MQTAFYEYSNQSFLESVGVKELTVIESCDFVLEDALPAQNKTNAEKALRALISNNGKAPNTAVSKAIYNRAIGWIGFIWGEPGKEPPEFATLEDLQAWWNNAGNRKELFSGGWGLSHIIAKRDWEGKHIVELEGQTGKNFVLTTLPAMLSKVTIPSYAKNNDRITIKQGITSITIDKVRNIVPQSIPYQRIEPTIPEKPLSTEYWVLTGFTLLGKQYANATLMLPKEKGLPSEENSPGKIVESADGSVASGAHPSLPIKDTVHQHSSWSQKNLRDCDPAFVKDRSPMTQGLSGATAKHLPTSIVLSDRSYAAGATDSIEETIPQGPQEGNGILERAAVNLTLLERKRLEISQAKTWDDIYNIFVDAFTPKRKTPLYDRLVAGEFNTLPWRSFVAMIERITLEENIAFPEMYDAICNYLTENEPLGGYNIDALTA